MCVDDVLSIRLCVCKIFSCLFYLLLYATIASSNNYKKCDKVASLAALEDQHTIIETSHKLLEGTWISEGCETRPGPEYVIRIYTFQLNGNFLLYQHHYWDDSCSSPRLTLTSHGRVVLRNSMVQPGAYTGRVKTHNISVTAQDNLAARELDRLVASQCPDKPKKSWRPNEEYLVYDGTEKMFNYWWSASGEPKTRRNSRKSNHFPVGELKCLDSLKWAFHELKLVKIQLRPVLDNIQSRSKHRKLELLLGDIHSNYYNRENYISTAFQTPLVKATKSEAVEVDNHLYTIKNSNILPTNLFAKGKNPPHLIEKPHLPPYIWGEWISTRCEVRPMSLYLTRRFTFHPEDSAWVGEHKFYADPFCSVPKFTVVAAGHFILQESSEILMGSTNIDFLIEKATLNVQEETVIYDIKLPGICGVDDWEVNVPQELSATSGCMQLGIVIPSIQYDVVKIEMDYKGLCLLYLGQADTDNLPRSEDSRPTAFQLPLVKCGEVPTYSQGLSGILNSNKGDFRTGNGYLLISMLFLYCFKRS